MAGFERGVRPIGDWSMSITLSNASIPCTDAVGARLHPGAVQPVRERLVDDVVDQRALARAADTPVTQISLPTGSSTSIVLEVVLGRAAWTPNQPRVVHAPVGHRDRAPAGQVRAGDRLASTPSPAPPCPRPRHGRRARPRPGPCRRCGRRRGSSPRRARPRSRCCRARAGARASPAAARCRAGAARSTARRGCRARPSGCEPIWVASRIRCASPPDRLAAARSSVR